MCNKELPPSASLKTWVHIKLADSPREKGKPVFPNQSPPSIKFPTRDLTRLVVPPPVGPMALQCFERLYPVQGIQHPQRLQTNMTRDARKRGVA
ncbi:hypothetical protein M8C21_030404 [Ambrosia artemisiifolia]|uniref:Uncharacterized protein n=1 Tax=Ambrosia artemisiifolia TaxID=4212 RepID=A0AAD5GC52_AMBAR|nr:hypothetical protein M8C21_030404 [Ambrosia artemisiifolia]